MDMYTPEELEAALKVVLSAIFRCEKTQPKFADGSSHHSLLKNRLKALYISKALITNENVLVKYSKE